MSNRLIQFAIICIGVTMLTSCATPVYRLYEATHLQQGKIAVLKNPSWRSAVSINIHSVDGIAPSDARWNKNFYGSKIDGSYRIEMLPGKHTLSFTYNSNKKQHAITFDAESGKVYTVKAALNKVDMQWEFWVEEMDDSLAVSAQDKAEEKGYTHFSKWGLTFDHPKGWQEQHPAIQASLTKRIMRRELRSYGRDLQELAVIFEPNDAAALMVQKYTTPKTMKPSEFIVERNQIYDIAKRAGNVTKVNHVKETTIATLPAVEEDVERGNKGRVRTYKVIDGTTVFEISFNVNDASQFSKYSAVLDHLVESINVAGKTENSQNTGGQK